PADPALAADAGCVLGHLDRLVDPAEPAQRFGLHRAAPALHLAADPHRVQVEAVRLFDRGQRALALARFHLGPGQVGEGDAAREDVAEALGHLTAAAGDRDPALGIALEVAN